MRGEGTKDRPNTNHLLDNIIQNGQMISLLNAPYAAGSLSYALVATKIINFDMIKKYKVEDCVFVVQSGAVSPGGLKVQLYDFTNAAIITELTFIPTDDNIIKTVSVLSYLISKAGRLSIQSRVALVSTPVVGSVVTNISLEIYNKLPGTNI